MSHKDLLKWLKKNRRLSHSQIVDKIKEKMSDEADYFVFWKDQSKNKRRFKERIIPHFEKFKKDGLIKEYSVTMDFGIPIVSGVMTFVITGENNSTCLDFNVTPTQ